MYSVQPVQQKIIQTARFFHHMSGKQHTTSHMETIGSSLFIAQKIAAAMIRV
jgi:hypothetical protein